MPAALAALGVAPEEVDAVLLTHMHPDHLGGLLAAGAAAFPNATVHVSETDLAFWTDEAIASKAPADFQPFFARARATAAAYGDRLIPFSGDGEVVPGVTSLALPGHTLGHTGFRLASDGAEIVVFGDAVNFGGGPVRPSRGRPRLRHRRGAGRRDPREAPRRAGGGRDAGRRNAPALPRHRPRGPRSGRRLRTGSAEEWRYQ